MKKLLALLLSISLLLSLAACGSDTEGDSASKEKKTPQFAAGVNKIEDVADFEIVNMYATDEVVPPNPGILYSHYAADSGNTYLVVVMKVTNTAQEMVNLSDLFEAELRVNGKKYTAEIAAEMSGGSNFNPYHEIQPLETARVYCMAQVPADSDLAQVELEIDAGKGKLSGALNIADFADAIPLLTVGQLITDGETLELTVNSIYTAAELRPENATGVYSYFAAEEGKVYLIVDCTAKNLRGNQIAYDKLANVSCVYNGKYKYSSFSGFLREDGISGSTSIYYLDPLESNTVYYLMPIPLEAENGPIEIKFYIAGQEYRYNFG